MVLQQKFRQDFKMSSEFCVLSYESERCHNSAFLSDFRFSSLNPVQFHSYCLDTKYTI